MVPDTRPPKPVPTAQPLWWLLEHIMGTEVERLQGLSNHRSKEHEEKMTADIAKQV